MLVFIRGLESAARLIWRVLMISKYMYVYLVSVESVAWRAVLSAMRMQHHVDWIRRRVTFVYAVRSCIIVASGDMISSRLGRENDGISKFPLSIIT
jgi:hypothetical protein